MALKLTKNQKAVYEKLNEAQSAMSAYDLLDSLRDQGLRAPVQVYRALEKLSDLGLVHRIESMNAYVACDHAHHQGTAAFAICESCGAVSEFHLEGEGDCLGDLVKGLNFKTERATVELRGRCANCQANAK